MVLLFMSDGRNYGYKYIYCAVKSTALQLTIVAVGNMLLWKK